MKNILLLAMILCSVCCFAITPEERKSNAIQRVKNWNQPLFIYKCYDIFESVYFVYSDLVHESQYIGDKECMHLVVGGQRFYFQDLICYEDIWDFDFSKLNNLD